MSKAKRTAEGGQATPISSDIYPTELDGFNFSGTADNRTAFANLFANNLTGKIVHLPPCVSSGGIRLDGPLIIPASAGSFEMLGAPGMQTALIRNYQGGAEGDNNYGFITARNQGGIYRRLYLSAKPGTTGGAAFFHVGSNTNSVDFMTLREITISNALTYGDSTYCDFDVGIYSSGLAKNTGAVGNRSFLIDGAFVGGCLGWNMKLISTKVFSGNHLNLVGHGGMNYGKVMVDGIYGTGMGSDSTYMAGPQIGRLALGNMANAMIVSPTIENITFGSDVYSVNIECGAHSTVTNGASTSNTRINGALQGS